MGLARTTACLGPRDVLLKSATRLQFPETGNGFLDPVDVLPCRSVCSVVADSPPLAGTVLLIGFEWIKGAKSNNVIAQFVVGGF